jgi:hypothetical protein
MGKKKDVNSIAASYNLKLVRNVRFQSNGNVVDANGRTIGSIPARLGSFLAFAACRTGARHDKLL